MAHLLPFVPVPALLGFVFLSLIPAPLSRAAVIALGVGAAVLPAILFFPVALSCIEGVCVAGATVPILSIDTGVFVAQIAMSMDPLSMVTGGTVVLVGALVLIYSGAYMASEPLQDLRRFFAVMNLFLAGMLAVVFAADVILLFLGWETIGLCSFMLIAFYDRLPKAVAAGRKALITTRVADSLLLAGLMMLFLNAGTTRLDGMLAAVPSIDPWRLAPIAGLIALGALGKSAQIPFHTWLPSAMAGPTPVSALLHSATMVAAGVILLARLAPLFAAAPEISAMVAMLGILTAALGALVALIQTDVKKLLAFSTMSQIGFMVLALGLGAPAVALSHFAIHAAFKSLLFLSAGVMSHAAGGSTAIEALRGSRYRQPLAFWSFAIGAASLAGLPVITAGWYSKEAVLAAVWSSGPWGVPLWLLAATAAVLTGAYAFRVVFVAASQTADLAAPPWGGLAVVVPLSVLTFVAVVGGMSVGALISFTGGAPEHIPLVPALLGAAAPILGVVLARWLVRHPQELERLATRMRHIRIFRVDVLYYYYFVRRFRRVATVLGNAEGTEAVADAVALRREGVDVPGLVTDDPLGRGASQVRGIRTDLITRATDGQTPVVRMVAGDPVGRLLIVVARLFVGFFVARFNPDRIDRAWMGLASGAGHAWALVRLTQTGRVRDHSLWIALGCAGLLLFAWGTSWR
ncbi:NADH-quinone oxidoreductase subunit L [Rhodopseudomonas palustris]|uniref:NADH-ubiquinone dehydrogenase chain L n=1 Tax=Rhodopseudomonas palustris (strain ATCC BAA-98 / CGA009) TaxID=258594 RepID=Q6N1Z8_RHOPA|nr:proton-conducting transporter membrane subunit [Rhodopseudomonas palustris]OPF92358.1 oxidoreductase [Rhodopseudomonas palustris]PPQ41828.1 oxidoreductase [Rhodopseudomonas palustris]QQM05817.1 NAD(P)H-quinone oxidoreductase subunit 2, chloroplastic [Rhodopseudomonas palustris]RJF64030.1 oxidoreductase [Rhodopseudomonas palustris]WAB77142.1 proton-conducting transporter membrane subunit [Rhodopseudomonas palustris]